MERPEPQDSRVHGWLLLLLAPLLVLSGYVLFALILALFVWIMPNATLIVFALVFGLVSGASGLGGVWRNAFEGLSRVRGRYREWVCRTRGRYGVQVFWGVVLPTLYLSVFFFLATNITLLTGFSMLYLLGIQGAEPDFADGVYWGALLAWYLGMFIASKARL